MVWSLRAALVMQRAAESVSARRVGGITFIRVGRVSASVCLRRG
jgi:hypothetical protein